VAHTFRVWAPEAEHVELVLRDERVPMSSEPGGWWAAAVEGAGHGTDYAFSVDGGDPRPDPRSPFQPEGIHGFSRVVDHDAFDWTDPAWRGVHLPSAVLYELHVGTFTPEGTFDAAIDRLDHLVSLGIDAVELLPVAEFSGSRGWGYDGVDLFAPHHVYGGPDGLKRLVDACHARGIGVVMDVVYNHLGPSGNYLGQFGPYFTNSHSTNWGDAVNFDAAWSDEVRSFVIDNAVMWLRDYHCDGLRLDAVHAIVDESALHVLEQMAVRVSELSAQVGRPLFLIAESDLNNPRFVRSREAGGLGLDAAWADEWHHALHAAFTGDVSGYYEDFGSMELLAKAIRQAWVYDGIWSQHRKRHHGRPPVGMVGHQFVVFTQNHDQVGNRAVGERLGALMPESRLKVAAALLMTTPFVPMLFQGEEWGATTPFQYFTDHEDPDLGRAVSEGRRSEFSYFGWKPDDVPDPQEVATFERSKLDWAEIDKPEHAELLEWHRALIRLRRGVPALSDGRMGAQAVRTRFSEDERWLVIERGPVTVACNVGASPVTVDVPADASVVLSAPDGVAPFDGRVELPPDGVCLLLL
jgi:maltooligosyltrehalose trehalohydrolase